MLDRCFSTRGSLAGERCLGPARGLPGYTSRVRDDAKGVWMRPSGRLMPHSTWLEDESPGYIAEVDFLDDEPMVWQPPQRARPTRPVRAAGRVTTRLPAITAAPITGPLPPSAQFVGPTRAPQWLGLLIAFAFVFAALGAALALIVGLLGPGAPAAASSSSAARPTVAPAPTATVVSTATTAPTATATPSVTPTVTVTATGSPGPSVGTASFASMDTSTAGSWQGVYGGSGYSVVADAQQLPSAVQLGVSGASVRTWQSSTSDGRALQKPGFPLDRIAACWYSTGTFTLDLNITGGQSYQVALYLVDWDQQGRTESVSLVDPSSGATLDTRTVSGFSNGEYLVWTVSGHVTIQIANGNNSPDAVASGLFLAPVPSSGGQT